MIGQNLSRKLSQRIKALERLQIMLNGISTELKYCLTPINDIMIRLSGREELKNLSFIKVCAQKCSEGELFPVAWNDGLDSIKKSDALLKSDIELLRSFGEVVGTTDLDGQMKICDLYSDMINEKLNNAREKFKNSGKLYSNMGFLIGAAFVIILL